MGIGRYGAALHTKSKLLSQICNSARRNCASWSISPSPKAKKTGNQSLCSANIVAIILSSKSGRLLSTVPGALLAWWRLAGRMNYSGHKLTPTD